MVCKLCCSRSACKIYLRTRTLDLGVCRIRRMSYRFRFTVWDLLYDILEFVKRILRVDHPSSCRSYLPQEFLNLKLEHV